MKKEGMQLIGKSILRGQTKATLFIDGEPLGKITSAYHFHINHANGTKSYMQHIPESKMVLCNKEVTMDQFVEIIEKGFAQWE